MKRISTYLILLLTTFVAGCEMDQYPYSEIAAEDYVKDAEAVNTLVVGAYNGLHGVMYHQWSLTELRSDNARMRVSGSSAQDTKLIEQLDQGTIGTAHDWVGEYWDNCYSTINRTNMVLGNLDVITDPALRAQYEGEALFLRSLIYFDMIRLYGPVFLVTKQIGADEARNMQRVPTEQIYAQIESDLERIVNEEMLPEQMPAALTGRATLVAAKALLAKVYMTHYAIGEQKYLAARTLLQDVLTAVGNPKTASELVPYAKIFAKDNEMNKEIIFAVRYLSGNVGLGSPFTTLFGPLNNGNSVVLGSPKHYNYPSDNLLAAYNANATDVRKAVVIAEGYTNVTTGAWKEERYMVKYLDPDMATEWDAENDWPVLRVGDIVLLLAELINEVDGPTEEALGYLNMIRERAGIPAYAASEVASRYQFREAVRAERRLELAFENQRWFDLLRWEIATATVNDFLAGEAFFSEYNYTVNPIEDWQTLLPIPLAVININPDVAQNVGY
ncbi:MAG: RagB/SusD family nutrient uptake outer membrane protein [Alistipes sp.]|nr:RagB/SusD family nutrient uptake outer membrane protein [Alistipes sp.]